MSLKSQRNKVSNHDRFALTDLSGNNDHALSATKTVRGREKNNVCDWFYAHVAAIISKNIG